jgi:hypothetical protein
LFSGGLSPFVTQRVVGRLASTIANARAIHLPSAGHMLAITHAADLIPDIADHITDADERAVQAVRRVTDPARQLELFA